MNHHYSDITDKLGQPLWWDEYAVPRYCEFAPRVTADIYADQVVLMEIACQNCGQHFNVAMSQSMSWRYVPIEGEEGKAMWGPALTLRELVESDAIHYGDPPNANCCMAGPTMNSEPKRVLQFWDRSGGDFVRVPELEREIACDWAEDGD